MNRKIVRFIGLFFILPAVFVIAAANADEINEAYWTDASGGVRLEQLNLVVGQERVIHLKAEVPADKTLKAYSLEFGYDAARISVDKVVAAPESVITPASISDDTPGIITINGFDMTGVKGETVVAIVDVAVKGLSRGASDLAVSFSAFGASGNDQFKPVADALKVIVNN